MTDTGGDTVTIFPSTAASAAPMPSAHPPPKFKSENDYVNTKAINMDCVVERLNVD